MKTRKLPVLRRGTRVGNEKAGEKSAVFWSIAYV